MSPRRRVVVLSGGGGAGVEEESVKYCEDDKCAKLCVLLCNRSLCLATTCCCLLFVGDVGRDRGVAEGIRFTGLVGRDSDDDRRTGLVFLERRVAKLNPQQKSPTGEFQSTKH